jgi:diguanylate cyclase (GGDEF)-like protein
VEENVATRDGLTGSCNRAYFDDQLRCYFDATARLDFRLGLMMLNLDRFAHINHAHGTRVGDALLRSVSSELAGFVRSPDIVARYGGDTFVVLVRDTSAGGLRVLADCLLQRIRSVEARTEHGLVRVTASFGCAARRGEAPYATPVSFMIAATHALRFAKLDGGNRIAVDRFTFDP